MVRGVRRRACLHPTPGLRPRAALAEGGGAARSCSGSGRSGMVPTRQRSFLHPPLAQGWLAPASQPRRCWQAALPAADVPAGIAGTRSAVAGSRAWMRNFRRPFAARTRKNDEFCQRTRASSRPLLLGPRALPWGSRRQRRRFHVRPSPPPGTAWVTARAAGAAVHRRPGCNPGGASARSVTHTDSRTLWLSVLSPAGSRRARRHITAAQHSTQRLTRAPPPVRATSSCRPRPRPKTRKRPSRQRRARRRPRPPAKEARRSPTPCRLANR